MMFRRRQGKREKPLKERNQNTKNGKDEDGEDCSKRTSAGKNPDDSTNCNENESDANNEPTRFVILLTSTLKWGIRSSLLLLPGCHAQILCQTSSPEPML